MSEAPRGHFADRLTAAIRGSSPLVAGLDPDFSLLPDALRPASADPTAIAAALASFCGRVLDAVGDLVAAVKPQSAFFEQHGSAGVAALAQVLAASRRRGLPIILDGKRGDIGSTAKAYAAAYLSGGSDLDADALTINPLLGEDSLAPFVRAALTHGRGLFVLVRTSNPGAALFFGHAGNPASGTARLASLVRELGAESLGSCGYSSIAAVVGATAPDEATLLRSLMPQTIFLMPGVGAQGANLAAISPCFGAEGTGAVVPISRGLTYPSPDEVSRHGFEGAVRERGLRYVEELRRALSQ